MKVNGGIVVAVLEETPVVMGPLEAVEAENVVIGLAEDGGPVLVDKAEVAGLADTVELPAVVTVQVVEAVMSDVIVVAPVPDRVVAVVEVF